MCASPAIGRTYRIPAAWPSVARIGLRTVAGSLVVMRGLTIKAAITGASAGGVMGAGAEQAANAIDSIAKTAADTRARCGVRIIGK